jgi:hypothetical protein
MKDTANKYGLMRKKAIEWDTRERSWVGLGCLAKTTKPNMILLILFILKMEAIISFETPVTLTLTCFH